MPAPLLTAPRLQLRAPRRDDARRLALLADDLDVTRMTSRMPHPYTLEHAQLFLARVEEADPSREVTWIIADDEGPQGVLGFFTDDGLAPEIGYWLGRPSWGRGYAGEAVGVALAWADTQWRKPCLLARCFTDNPASMRVLEKAGFLPTGVQRSCPSLARGGDAMSREYVRLA